MKPKGLRDLEPHGNHKHPRAKRKGVYGFQGYLNPVGPRVSLYTNANPLLSNRIAHQWLQFKFSTSELSFKLFADRLYLVTIQLSTDSDAH